MSFDSLKGSIYIEAFKEANVREAIQGISALKENSIKIVPLTEMTQVFNYDKLEKIDLKPRQWVRIKFGVYEGDLAQVLHVEDPINKIYVRMIPRISEAISKDSKDKKGKDSIRPKQKLFNPIYYDQHDIRTNTHPILREAVYVWNKMTFKDGFLVKSVRAKSLEYDNVVPKIDELKIFEQSKYKKDEDGNVDIDSLIQSIQDTEINKRKSFNKGDKVKVIKGSLIGITGKVTKHADGLVNIIPDIEGVTDILEFPEDQVIKQFLPGDIVRVINGPHIGKCGLIMKIEEDTAIIYSETTDIEVKVSLHDIVLSSQMIYETEQNSYFQLGDLVKINGSNAICYVLDVHKHSLKLLDTRSEIKNVSTRDVTKVTQMYIL